MQTVKGSQRRMVQVRIGNSRYYEEALFIVRRDLPKAAFPEREMLAEANRILRENAVREERQANPAKALAWLFGGMVLGFALAIAVFFLCVAS